MTESKKRGSAPKPKKKEVNESPARAETVEKANAAYSKQQESLGMAFKSPFATLNLTLEDCLKQRKETGISDAEFERDKGILRNTIEEVIANHGYPDTNQKVDGFLLLANEFVRNGMNDTRYPQNYWPLVACHAALCDLHNAEQTKGLKIDAVTLNIALFAQGMMNIAWKPAQMDNKERIAGNALQFANHFAVKKKKNEDQLAEARKREAEKRSKAAEGARKLAKDTLYPEWRAKHPDDDKVEGYKHCAKVLTEGAYKNANGAPITWKTVKGYFRKPRTKK
jgi:hypothetical protein